MKRMRPMGNRPSKTVFKDDTSPKKPVIASDVPKDSKKPRKAGGKTTWRVYNKGGMVKAQPCSAGASYKG